jgi:hypothetical protein
MHRIASTTCAARWLLTYQYGSGTKVLCEVRFFDFTAVRYFEFP